MSRAQLPLVLRGLNHSAKLGINPELRPAKLLKQARNDTGLLDFGDSRFHEGLERLCEALNTEAQLSVFGKLMAAKELRDYLKARLRIVEHLKQNPRLSAAAIEQPLFVLGLPRTGTSITHELLAQDPSNRVPLSWEVRHPYPPPKTATYTSDLRIAKTAKELANVDQLMPGFKQMHPMGAEFPQECVAITAMDFRSMIFDTQYRVPSYQHWLEHEADMAPALGWHKQFLQYLQGEHMNGRWVLKTPAHLWCMEALLAVYPDARIVQTHRDPLKVIASISSLMSMLRSLSSEHLDQHDIAKHFANTTAVGLDRGLAARRSGLLPEKQVYDLHFADLLRDPVAAMANIYHYFGLSLSDQAATAMQGFLSHNASDKHGTHRYAFSDTGLDLAATRARFEDYQHYHQVPSEVT